MFKSLGICFRGMQLTKRREKLLIVPGCNQLRQMRSENVNTEVHIKLLWQIVSYITSQSTSPALTLHTAVYNSCVCLFVRVDKL